MPRQSAASLIDAWSLDCLLITRKYHGVTRSRFPLTYSTAEGALVPVKELRTAPELEQVWTKLISSFIIPIKITLTR